MTQKQLEIFKVLAETLNFTRTAEQLSMSQTTVTLQIHNLEEELNLKLFERTSRIVRLTPAGQVFYDGIEKVLDMMDQTINSALATAQGYTGQIDIGFVDESNATGISSMIREYLISHPTIRPEFHCYNPADLLNRLLAGKCDVIFTPSIDNLKTENLKNFKIGHFDLIAAFNKDHRFGRKESLKYKDFEGEKFIYVAHSSAELDFTYKFVKKLEQHNVHISTFAKTDNIDTVFFMVDANLAVTVIPEYFAERFYGKSNIRICKVDEKNTGTDFIATWRVDKPSPELNDFLKFMKKYFSDK